MGGLEHPALGEGGPTTVRVLTTQTRPQRIAVLPKLGGEIVSQIHCFILTFLDEPLHGCNMVLLNGEK